jgi:hypothetical protein
MQSFTTAGAGFLAAVLWFDLMFDVQLLGHGHDIPDTVLTSISLYYKRVTTDARPMNRLVAAVMLGTIASSVTELVRNRVSHWAAGLSLALVIGAVALAGSRTVPSAVRLGSRRDPTAEQSALARSILRDHLACLAAIVALLVIQLAWAR